jgi:hypothetical protein
MAPTIAEHTQNGPIIVKLGRQSRKRIKSLSEGHGKLFDEVMATVEELRKNGQISDSAQPLIFVVKQEHEFSLFG